MVCSRPLGLDTHLQGGSQVYCLLGLGVSLSFWFSFLWVLYFLGTLALLLKRQFKHFIQYTYLVSFRGRLVRVSNIPEMGVSTAFSYFLWALFRGNFLVFLSIPYFPVYLVKGLCHLLYFFPTAIFFISETSSCVFFLPTCSCCSFQVKSVPAAHLEWKLYHLPCYSGLPLSKLHIPQS